MRRSFLESMIRFSIDRASIVVILAAALLALTWVELGRMTVDVFPELEAPTVVIMTETPGLASDEIESYVTLPIEGAMSGIPGVRRLRTASTIGLSIAYVEFGWSTDIYRARQLVAEALDTVRGELPEGAHAAMTPITSITGEIMLLAVSSPEGTVSPLELRSFAEYELRRRLLALAGVAQVSVIGGELPEYRVVANQDTLRALDLTLADVVDAAREAHGTASAGYLADVGGVEVPIRQDARVRSSEDIAATVVRMDGPAPLTLGQVADVSLGAAPQRGAGADAGRPAVILTVLKAPGTSTLAITDAIDASLDTLESSIPAGIHIERQIFRQADFIRRSVDSVLHALRDAAIIVLVILLLFLMSVRTTLIALTALPLSLSAGLLALHAIGETINVMTLGGLAIAVGSLVDDAIIDVENVIRRRRENARRRAEERRADTTVLFEASNEIRPAMTFATLIIVLVFLPLMFLEGIEGRFFRPLAIAFTVSILASLLVALTVTPALCRLLLRDSDPSAARETRFIRLVQRLYDPALRFALRFRAVVIGGAAVATVVALVLASSFGSSFLPEFNEGTFSIGLFAPPGTSLTTSDRMASAIERRFLELDGVRSVTRRTGRAERDEHVEPVSSSEIDVTLEPGATKQVVRARIREVLDSVPGVSTNIGQPIEHRLSHILSGTPAAIAISIYGDDLDELRTIAGEVETAVADLPGTRDVSAHREARIRSLPVDYDMARLASFGITPASAASQVRDAFFGAYVATIHDGVKRHDLAVRLAEAERDEPEDLEGLVLRGKNGAHARLDEVAVIGPQWVSYQILREDGRRKAVVSLNVADGSNLGHLVERVRERVDPIVERRGYEVRYGGQFEARESARRTILLFGIVALVVVVVMLQIAVGSWRVAALVLLNLPLALIGGIMAIFLVQSDHPFANLAALVGIGSYAAPVLSIAGIVGFITLFGIALRNGILLVNHYEHLQTHEGCSLDEAIRRGSRERLIPILMTALTAALALVPIALRGHHPGNEILAPLSVVILGGLLTSTFLNLVVVPAGYALVHRDATARPNDERNPTD